jgi:hypothetical protein
VGGLDAGRLGLVLGGAISIDRCGRWYLMAKCCPCIIECIASASTFTFSMQNSMCQNLNSICNISIFIALNSWFVCVYM